ncbi:hypothetical protein HYH03_009302 [Edaphochlamys debaryana]|uniref:Uncharacterized protein n=1 Tax=Edaphochlamys debaryana TaxID=47281 RepID=A0A836BYL2_9CHLO|nr:hypothetical protein HYH03_009302 [Edaphochlamys debaryana]|eukprot:KAG2492354.1 hypothetical protein HYH03_009302 [Edaphochlamys debaryana]
MAPVSIVTGASRGIGLALCRKLKSQGYSVIATCRKPTPELEQLGVRVVQGVDVARDDGCAPLAAAVSGPVDLLVCNAGLLAEDSLDDVSTEGVLKQFEVNSLGPLRTYLSVKGHLGKGAKVVIITSRMGSIADNTSGGDYGYRMSKAAVNMLGKSLALDLKKDGIAVGLLHPGMVKTEMIRQYWGSSGIAEPEQAAEDLVHVIDSKLTLETSGSFWHRSGQELPW